MAAAQVGRLLGLLPPQLPAAAAERQLTRGLRWLGLATVLAGFLALAVAWNVVTPLWEGSDEPHHVDYIRFILVHRAIPTLPSSMLEGHQPPLYYLVGAAVVKVAGLPLPPTPDPKPPGTNAFYIHDEPCGWCGGVLTVRVLRLLSTTFALGALAAVYATLRLVFDPLRALAGAAMVGFIPQFTFFSALVNNDSLSDLIGSLVVYFAVRIGMAAGAAGSLRWALGGGTALGVGLWTKEYAFAWAPTLAAGVWLAGGGWRRLRDAAAVVGSALVVASPLLVRNLVHYGTPWPFAQERASLAGVFPAMVVPRGITDPVLWTILPPEVWQSFWYRGGWGQLALPKGAYALLFALVLPVFLFALLAIVRPALAAFTTGATRSLLIGLVAVASAYAGILYTNLSFQVWPGRYLFPAAPALALLLVTGLSVAAPSRVKVPVVIAAAIAMLAFNILVLTRVAATAY